MRRTKTDPPTPQQIAANLSHEYSPAALAWFFWHYSTTVQHHTAEGFVVAAAQWFNLSVGESRKAIQEVLPVVLGEWFDKLPRQALCRCQSDSKPRPDYQTIFGEGALERAVNECNGSIRCMSKRFGCDRQTIRRHLERLGQATAARHLREAAYAAGLYRGGEHGIRLEDDTSAVLEQLIDQFAQTAHPRDGGSTT